MAAPNDTINRGAWWSIYRDPTLDGLERQINISNQTLKQDEAAFQEARAEVREQQSSFFPSLTVTPQVQRQKSGGDVRFRGGAAITSYSLEGTATWEPDVWGKIRRSVESSVANAQASAAQLAAARLSAQALLATDYFELRYADSLKNLLDDTVKGYQRSLEITKNQYAAGNGGPLGCDQCSSPTVSSPGRSDQCGSSTSAGRTRHRVTGRQNAGRGFDFTERRWRNVFPLCRPMSLQLCWSEDLISLKPSDRCSRRTR